MRLFRRRPPAALDLDEVFLDARNLPDLDTQQFEGRLERPISRRTIAFFFGACVVVGVGLWARVGYLQVFRGSDFAARSANNTVRENFIFAERGIITDRRNEPLVSNFPDRQYLVPGTAHLVGYVGYPTEDELTRGISHPKELVGRQGVEAQYDAMLRGIPGLLLEEVDATGAVVADYQRNEPVHGEALRLSVDARLTRTFHDAIRAIAEERGFAGGAGVIMDVTTGELLVLTSFPEFDPTLLSATATSSAAARSAALATWQRDPRTPFLDRVTSGLYTPGSIVKPFMALAALEEKTITPETVIVSTGALTLPNPYDPDHPSVFRDWKALGALDLRHAIAMSSDVYFYVLGGGFGSRRGVGIRAIDSYASLFGLAAPTGIDIPGEVAGTIPSPEWKEKNFNGDPWRVGDTYHTVIGQYGFQVTPLQMVRAVAAIATNGRLLVPRVRALEPGEAPRARTLPIARENFTIVREGMRLAVEEGTAMGLSQPRVAIAAKTGTAELGVSKENVNSWTMGFWPASAPRYAFAVVMERGHRSNTVGAVAVMRRVIDWMIAETPEYLDPVPLTGGES